MPTAKGGYHTADGKKVPGVTTVISAVKLGGIEPLLIWANRVGLEGKSHREERDKAADAGTCAHEMVECDIRGLPFDRAKYDTAVVAIADEAFKAYKAWARQTNLKTVHTEVGLVSEDWNYGGTMDALLVDGELALGDWKTSGGVYIDMLIQLAAYGHLWEENHPDQPITGGFHLIRFSKPKNPGDPVHFSHHHWSQLDVAWGAFKHMLALYTMTAQLKGML